MQLLTDELIRPSEWFEGFLANQRDRQIEADIRAGQLEAAGRRTGGDFEACLCTPLTP